ncbi:carboxymethylenebutenolidase [Marmoricola sp. OAE513]|uniref:dienelactone hydrolase family protein n=1 Tax=Marmoricola sp. OAE513 TaxID=2817894 RepID=UPI001AE7182A
MIEIDVPGGRAEAWLSRPAETPAPGVLLYMDAIGLRPQISAIADRIASWGCTVLAPNVFWRDGRTDQLAPTGDLREPGARDAFFAEVGPRIASLAGGRTLADIDAYVGALRALEEVAPGPIGVTGYCMGARLAVRTAARHEDVAACGGFHGGNLVTEAEDSPHRGLPTARAEFVFGHADGDRSMSPEAVEALGVALTEAGLAHSNEIYPGAPHGYVMADTSMYDEAGAERHYSELRELLERTLQ